MDADGAGEHDVSNDRGGPDIQPAWSPNGMLIAFVKQRSTGSAIWVMREDGTHQVKLTDATSTNVHPTWSIDGSSIVFASDRDGNMDLYRVAPDGTDFERITFTPGMQEDNPNFSPDQRYILFDACEASTFPCPGNANYDIYVMRADGRPPGASPRILPWTGTRPGHPIRP